MHDKISTGKISALSATLLIPLWAKAVEYEHTNPLLKDSEAARMMPLIDYDFSQLSSANLSQPGCCGRALLIDNETLRFIRQHPDAVIVQLGAGLDARFERLGKPAITAWYDLDLPEVIAVRRQLLPESGNHYLSDSLFNQSWTEIVAAHQKPVLLLLEGLLMYFNESEVKAFFALLARCLPQATVVFDLLPPLGLGRAKRHDALKNLPADQRPEFRWALADPFIMESWQPDLKVIERFYLSEVCGKRYSWWIRAIYKTAWERRNMDVQIVTVKLGK